MLNIPDSVYADLNNAIERQWGEDGFFEGVEIEADFEFGGHTYYVVLTCDLEATSKSIRFSDDAWGNVRWFTETTHYLSVSEISVRVEDEDENVVESDFDESKIETEYESTDNWY